MRTKLWHSRTAIPRLHPAIVMVCAAVWLALLAACNPSEDDSQARQCVQSLKVIESAKMVWALYHHKASGDAPTDADLFGPDKEVKEKPQCPAGGAYRLGQVGEKPVCNVPGHVIDRMFK